MIRLVASLVLAAALAAPAAAAPARTQTVDLGGTPAYVRTDAAVPLAGIELVVRAGLERETTAQNGLAALVAECVLQTKAGGTSLADAVDARGASISFAVGPQNVRFYLEGTPAGIAAAAPLVAAALAAPAFDETTLAAARGALGERIDDEEGDPRLVGRAMLRTAYYRGAAGLPALGTRSALGAFATADARAFYGSFYRRGGAFVTMVGRTGDATNAAGLALAGALTATASAEKPAAIRTTGPASKQIVTHRDVGAPYVLLGFAAPALGDRDFAPALVVRALLGGLFVRPSATSLPALFRPAGTLYGTDVAPAQLVLWINGARVEPDTGLAAVRTVAKALAAKPLPAAAIARYKQIARGSWELEPVALDRRACAIGDAVSRGLDPDAADAAAVAIDRVTPADVQRVAKKYFQRFDAALILPRG